MKTESPQAIERGNGRAIWVFTPSRTDPKDLEYILVQREPLLQDAVERVSESALTAHKHHQLFVGPRGCGKTHLTTLIVSRLTDDEELTDKLRIAWLNEDETCTTLLELLVKVHGALEKRYPLEFKEDMLGPAYDMKPDAALEFVSRHLLSELGSRTLLLVTENLDEIFENLGEVGQKQFRSFIQENPKLTIVATAQRLVEDLSDRNSPFFGFFQTEHLKPLTVEQATELLQNIARLQEKDEVVEFLATSRGRSRVRAIHHLSGGNHRIYIVLSQFITRDSIDALLGPFMKMVDELTPYYQERIRWLPPLQRKIVEYLCTCEGTVPVKEIARRLFTSPPTISSQLLNLREKGYVESNQRGRESLYEISEPLMRICVEVKDNQRHQPLRLLVDFLRVWYDDEQLKHHLGSMEPASLSCAYLESAIKRNRVEGNLRQRILLENLQSDLEEELRDEDVRKLEAGPEEILIAMQNVKEDNWPEAIRCLDEANIQEMIPRRKADILLCRAALHSNIQDYEKEIEDYSDVISLANASVEQMVVALFGRASAYIKVGKIQRAIDDYTAISGLSGASIDQVAEAFLTRGVGYYLSGEVQRAIDDFSTVIKLPGAPVEIVAKALICRGINFGLAGESKRAIDDFTTVVDQFSGLLEMVTKALYFRGCRFFNNGQKQESKADFESLICLPNAPMSDVAKAHFALSKLYFSGGQWNECFRALESSLECGATAQPVYQENAKDLIGGIFSASLNAGSRRDKVNQLLQLYSKYQALPVLGEAVVLHIGGVFRAGELFPSADNLDSWVSAWEQAAESVPDFRLSFRLLKTAVEFVKAGGKDRAVLLDLASAERSIVEQALGLVDEAG
jgi:tetratricopeptide (TPR) repeat protein/energy-coupling factor transporter ATP-binding protein EcfA2